LVTEKCGKIHCQHMDTTIEKSSIQDSLKP
jgi:hypothetical protein